METTQPRPSPIPGSAGSPRENAGPLPLCLLVPAGPGPEEIHRLADLMEASARFATLPFFAVIINDGNDADALQAACGRQGVSAVILPNARRNRGDWWTGGLCMGMLDALLWIGRNTRCSGVLRLDSDALIINPFARELCAIFAGDPTIGIVGNYDSPTGAPAGFGHLMTSRLYWRSKWVSRDRENHKFIASFWGWRRRLRRLIKAAQTQGYPLGEWCQGGAYALSPSFLARLVADPRFSRPEDFLPIDICEDTLMILVIYAVGLKAHYTVGVSRLFASKWEGLLDSPEALSRAGHGVVHSVKYFGERKEQDIRAAFRGLRQQGTSDQRERVLPQPPGEAGFKTPNLFF